MFHHFILRGNIGQFPAQHLMTAGMQFPAALQTDLFGFRQFMDDLFHGKARKIQFPFSFLLPPLICDLLQFWFRHLCT